MVLKLSWTLDGDGGNKKISAWDDIEFRLDRIEGKDGTLTIDVINSNEIEAECLQLRAEKGFYFMTLGGVKNGEYVVKTYRDLSQPDIEVMILGDNWPAQNITKNFDIVKLVFKEFFDTGNVETRLLN